MPGLAAGRLIGLVTAENVGEFFTIRSALQSRGDASPPPSAPVKVPPVITVPPVIRAGPVVRPAGFTPQFGKS